MATIKDIAQKAQVSVWTVSKILNNSPGARIADVTREKVLKVVNQVGYKRDDMARAVRTGRAKVIGFAAKTTPSSYAYKLLSGVMSAAGESDYFVKLFDVKDDSTPEQLIAIARRQRISALIAYTLGDDFNDKLYKMCLEQSLPLAVVSNDYVPEECIHVNSDDDGGIKNAMQYLYKLGHRKIGYLGNSCGDFFSLRRYQAFLNSASELGIEKQSTLYLRDKMLENYNQFEYIESIISKRNEKNYPTAFVCEGDNLAVMLSQHFLKAGIKVPEDISIIGFGNLPFGALNLPPLTTIAEPHVAIGEKSVQILLKSFNNMPRKKKYLIKNELVIRESTASPNIS